MKRDPQMMYRRFSLGTTHFLIKKCDVALITVQQTSGAETGTSHIRLSLKRSLNTTSINMLNRFVQEKHKYLENEARSTQFHSSTVLSSEKEQNHNDEDCNKHQIDYAKTILTLNQLQSNTQNVALAKYRNPKEILPLFSRQLALAGITSNDLNKLKIIHISGTKGKGSTCAFVESIIHKSGLKTGFYNSPHLVKVTERIRINTSPIDDHKFCRYFREIFERLTIETEREKITMPSYFSFLTILAFHIFIEEKVDCAIIEVGIGGEYDPTNIIQNPVACGITAIHFDHMNILGNTIESIAWSKAGIAKPKVPIFTVEQEQDSAFNVIKSRAQEKDCSLYVCKSIKSNLQLGISGSVQYSNASLACQLARYFLELNSATEKHSRLLSNDDLNLDTNLEELPQFYQSALRECFWPGRCQVVPCGKSVFFLDGAHTKESMENSISWFLRQSNQMEEESIKILMINIIGDRNKVDILEPLIMRQQQFRYIIFSTNKISSNKSNHLNSETYTKFQNDKSIENAQNNMKTWITLVKDIELNQERYKLVTSTSECIELVKKLAEEENIKNVHVLVTGSLHFVGAFLESLRSFENFPSKVQLN